MLRIASCFSSHRSSPAGCGRAIVRQPGGRARAGRLLLGLLTLASLSTTRPAVAYDVLVQESTPLAGAVPGDLLFVDNTIQLFGDESFAGWDWSLFCTGCTFMEWQFNYIPPAPPFVPPNWLAWNNQEELVGPAILDPPNGVGTSTLSAIGGFDLTDLMVAGPAYLVGTAVIRIDEPSGTIASGFSPGEGFSTAGVVSLDRTTNSLSWGPVAASPPEAEDDVAEVTGGGSVNVDVAANDSDVNGDLDPLSTTIETAPGSGNAVVEPDGTVTYTNTDPLVLQDSFSYRIFDLGGLSDTADVSIGILGEPDLVVAPGTLSFGAVDFGSSELGIVTLTNDGTRTLTLESVDLEAGSPGAFLIVSAPAGGTELAPGADADVTLQFTPDSEALVTTHLEIRSDDPDTPLALVELSGEGVSLDAQAMQLIDEVLDPAVDAGTIEGDGPGGSASGRLGALRNMLEAAGDLIEAEDFEAACDQLQDALDRMDGASPPPDFVATADGAPAGSTTVQDLADEVTQLRENLDCEALEAEAAASGASDETACGMGAELALLLPGWMALRRRRRSVR